MSYPVPSSSRPSSDRPRPGQQSRHTSGSIAASLQAELIGPSDLPILGVETLESAGPETMTFIRSAKYANEWKNSQAGAALVTRGIPVPGHDPSTRALLVVSNADLAMITLLKLFSPSKPSYPPGVHPTAVVDKSAMLGQGVYVGPNCFVGADSVIGDGSVLVANVYIAAEVSVGAITTLHPGVVVLDRCVIGSACTLWPNVVIGADGFGYVPSPDKRGVIKVPHIGNVVLEDGVEVGACTCIDRGKFGATTIGAGTKIDNQVQIAHNVRVGRSCLICGVSGLAGSVTIGDGVTIAGHVGICDNVHVGAGATIAAMTGVIGDVPAGEVWSGFPAQPHNQQLRSWAAVHKLPEHVRTLRRLERAMIDAGLIQSDKPTELP